MKLWLISQEENNEYDTYDSAVVAAESEEEAKRIHPSEYEVGWDADNDYGTWAPSRFITVKLIGESVDGINKGVVVASFNAG